MEPWKIGVILALFAGIVGFGAYQQKVEDPAPGPVPSGTAIPSPLLGTTPPAWNIPAKTDWVNTPAPITLPALKKQIAVVEIFRTECPHCVDAAPVMEMLYKHYGPKGVKFVALQSPGDFNDAGNPENKWPDVLKWLKEKGVQYPVGFDRGSKYFQGTFPGDKENKLYPTMFVLDRDSKIRFIQTGFDAEKAIKLVAGIEKQLGTGPDLDARLKAIAEKLVKVPEFATMGSTTEQIVQALKDIVEEKPAKAAE